MELETEMKVPDRGRNTQRMTRTKSRTPTDQRCLIELGHVYLEELEQSGVKSVKTDAVERTIAELDARGIPFVVIIIVDDTSATYQDSFGTDDFDRHRTALAEAYIDSLPVPIDEFVFESEFGPTVEHLLAQVPTVEPSKLGDPNVWGLLVNDSKQAAYLYGQNKPGQTKPKAKVKDWGPKANKSTIYTCQAYDAAMAMTKLGVVDLIDRVPASTHAISFHESEFMESPPHKKSQLIREILESHEIVTSTDSNHLEVTHDVDIKRVVDFIDRHVN